MVKVLLVISICAVVCLLVGICWVDLGSGPTTTEAVVVPSSLGASSHFALKRIPARTEKIELDAGIVFANEASYICFPLSRFGTFVAADVLDLESSCECVRPSLVRYVDHYGQESEGLRLSFVARDYTPTSTDSAEDQPSLLSVELRIHLEKVGDCVVAINFLLTYLPRN